MFLAKAPWHTHLLRTTILSRSTFRTMSTKPDLEAAYKELGSGRYSACDISDTLLKLKVPNAGFLPDILPIPTRRAPSKRPLIAPLSTVLFSPKSGPPQSSISSTAYPLTSNIPSGKHFTDVPASGSVVLLQQPPGMICACLGDIMANRMLLRGVKGILADGRIRDLGPIGAMCDESASGDNPFTVWSKGNSTVGTGLEAKAWAVDVPLVIGGLEVNAGDLIFVDEVERGCVVIPQDKVNEVVRLAPGMKDSDDLCVSSIKAGVDVTETFAKYRT